MTPSRFPAPTPVPGRDGPPPPMHDPVVDPGDPAKTPFEDPGRDPNGVPGEDPREKPLIA